MPELPEVETVVRGLRKTALGKTIARVQVRAPKASLAVSESLGCGSFTKIIKRTFLSCHDSFALHAYKSQWF